MGRRYVCLLAFVAWGCDDDGGSPALPGAQPDVMVDAAIPDAAPPDADPRIAEQALIEGVPETAAIRLPGLTAEVHVVRTEGDIPHVYAADRLDMARVQGYLVARDRFFMMDLARRLSQGTVSELVGDLVLNVDITSRNQGMRHAAQRVLMSLSDQLGAEFDAFAEGVNHYIARVADGTDPAPSEMAVTAPVLGVGSAAELMDPFTRADIAAFATTVLYLSGYEPIDLEAEVGIEAALDGVAGAAFEDLRRAGLLRDIFERIAPIEAVASIESGANTERSTARGSSKRAPLRLPATAKRLVRQMRRMQSLLGKSSEREFGSNAWAVAGTHTANGDTLVEGDGHLSLSVPGFFVQMGLDTRVFGGTDDPHVRGLFVPGLPPLGVGTNGHVAWSFTYFNADVTDWYREELQLGDDGLPAASMFRGEWKPLRRVDETYTTRAVPALGSEGGEVTIARWETFDGRRIMVVEGVPIPEGEAPGPDDAVVNLGDGPVAVGDADRDGVVTAVSMDYVGLDVGGTIGAYDDLGKARNIAEFQQAQRRIAVFGSHFAAGDSAGDILITGYHASPCRAHLPRGADGRFEPGADPSRVLDGTRFGGFTVAYNDDGTVDDTREDETHCVVSYADFPAEVSPARGYVLTANNDPSGLGFDDNVANDPVYIGTGNWSLGFRAKEIRDALAETAAAKDADVAKMVEIQNIQVSVTGRRYAPLLVAAIERAAGIEGGEPHEARLAALHTERMDAAAQRLRDWGARGYRPASGVETFYDTPSEDDRADAVATMVFNAWLGHFTQALLGDEADLVTGDGTIVGRRQLRTVDLALFGRGADNPNDLASWNPETEESVFFDVRDTPEVERSDELMLMALGDALAFLESEPTFSGRGGFGSAAMEDWLWGLRHVMLLESLLTPFLPPDAGPIAALLQQFGITPSDLPLAFGLENGDPRLTLPGFPRGGDNFNVDNGDPGLSGTEFAFRHGPVMRMVISLKDGVVGGRSIIPGGQSGISESAHRHDQLELWLANDAWPLRYHTADVVDGAVGREVYRP